MLVRSGTPVTRAVRSASTCSVWYGKPTATSLVNRMPSLLATPGGTLPPRSKIGRAAWRSSGGGDPGGPKRLDLLGLVREADRDVLGEPHAELVGHAGRHVDLVD